MTDLRERYNPFIAPQLNEPQTIWAQARDESPVFYSDVLNAWIVTSYADVVTVLRNPDEYGPVASRKLFSEACAEADAILATLPDLTQTNLVSAEPPVHTKLRRYLQPAFTPRRAAHLESQIRTAAHALIDGFVDRGSGDFYEDFAFRYPLTVMCRLIGIPDEHQLTIKKWATQRISLRYGSLTPVEQVEAAKGQVASHEFTLKLVAWRREEPGDDLLSAIVTDSDASDDPLTDEQLGSQVTSLLTAGHETSSHWLTMMVRRLVEDRDLWMSLAGPEAPINAILEESLRMDGPAQAVWRTAKADVELGGVRIPAGQRLSVVLGSADLDGAVFDSPEDFVLERRNVNQHVAFGRGIHTCVGAGVARLEARVALEVLSSRLPKLRRAADDGLMFAPSAIQRMPKRLYLEWT